MRSFHQSALIAALLLSGALSSSADAAFNQLFVFGDSLSDDGNVFKATGFTYPPTPPYAGHFSNGPVAVERLASDLGVSLVASSLLPPAAGGTNYAYGGATTGTANFLAASNPALAAILNNTGIQSQVTNFKNSPPAFNAPSALFVVWGGPNDFFLDQSAAAVTTAVGNLSQSIIDLYGKGARNFLVPNMADLSTTPFGRGLNQQEQAGLHALSLGFDSGLAQAIGTLRQNLRDSTIYSFNTLAATNAVIANPGAFGLTNVTDACVSGNTVCADPNQFLFWDSVHPTSHVARILGDEFAQAVPEAQTWVELSLGLVLLGILKRRAST